MIIAIDYDETYTSDPTTFDKVIKLFLEAGHTVICVTGRSGDTSQAQPVLDSIGKIVPVVFAGTAWKRDAALQQGYKVNIWVDDIPNMISPQNLMSPRNIRGSNG